MARSYDNNRYRKTYPLYRQTFKSMATVESTTLAYSIGEGVVEKTFTFSSAYSTVPNVVATAEGENVNVYITAVTTTSVTLKPSEAFTGNIHIQVADQG